MKEIYDQVRKLYPQYKGWKIFIEDLNYPSTREMHCAITFDNKLFDEVYGGPLMISPKIILSHEPLDIDWAFNIHGHTHDLMYELPGHHCVCSDVVLYKPISLAEILKSGRVGEVTTIHRTTIDKATQKKQKRKKKKK